MEQTRYLIDSNSVIDYLGEKLPSSGMSFMNKIIDEIPRISVITKIEVMGFNAADKHYKVLTDFMNDAIILGISDEITEQSIAIRKRYRTKLPDAIIAATALVHHLTLVTRNTNDFKNITGLKLLNPFEQ